jgi:autotransporter-associated beta strand protein
MGLGSAGCGGDQKCRDPFTENCCETKQSVAAGLVFTQPRNKRSPAFGGRLGATVTGWTTSPILIYGIPVGQVGKRCPINVSFRLCWDKFNIEPVPCGSDFENLDVTVCWWEEFGDNLDSDTTNDLPPPDELNFSGCNDITVWLGFCGEGTYFCTTTLAYYGPARTSNASIEIYGGAIIKADGDALVLTGTFSIEMDCGQTLTLTGTSVAGNEIASVIPGPNLSVHKTGTGLWRLSGASSYDGQLKVLGGTLVVAANVGETGASPFGTQTVSLPVIGNSAAGGSGTAALLLANGVEISRGFSVDGPAGSPQIVVIGGEGAGDSVVTFQADITLGRSVTLQAATGGTITFSSSWSGGGGSVGVTIGSAGNGGTVALEQALPVTLSGVNVVNGRAELYGTDLIAPATPVTVGSSLGSAVLNLNSAYEEVSQALSDLSFAGNSGSITGGTLRLVSDPAVSVTGTGHTISSLVALDDDATFDGSGSLTISGVVSGAYGLTKDGTGTLTLSGNNTFADGLSIDAGVVVAGHVNALGTGTVDFSGDATIRLGVAGTVANNVSVATDVTGTVDTNGNAVTASGSISGGGGIKKTGSGTLTLPVAPSHSGGTQITGGSLITQALVSGPAKVTSATFTAGGLTVAFSSTPLSGEQYKLLPGETVNTYGTVTLTGAGSATAAYDSETSTLVID